MPHLEIDYKRCTKNGQCYYLHPEAFRDRGDGHPEATQDRFSEEMRDALEEAADLCPTEAIAVKDEA
jgi:ferredoxin